MKFKSRGTVIAIGGLILSTSLVNAAPSSCPAYGDYSQESHQPLSSGPLKLPFQRPEEGCRLFKSDLVDQVIDEYKKNMADPDLARLFENTYPNTLDTTIRWHVNNTQNNSGPRTFIITGDINAQWLRDSRFQVYNYHVLAPFDSDLKTMLIGAIHQQADFVTQYPHCNAFHPPKESGLEPGDGSHDKVTPPYDDTVVWECMFELDSLSAFFGIASDFNDATGETSFVDDKWVNAARIAIKTIQSQQIPTYSANGTFIPPEYTFQRNTTSQGTLNLAGDGNPVGRGTHLVRSPFRPSDDTAIFQFFIPSNAALSVELKRAAALLKKSKRTDVDDLVETMETMSKQIHDDIYKHAIIDHPDFGEVFAYEVDGFGSRTVMDDANIPSLLALPDVGFVDIDDEIYQRTRKMILQSQGNPYFISGKYFNGIGGPHVSLENAWPMSHIAKIRTTDDDNEIKESLELLKGSTAGLGLMHESVNVNMKDGKDSYTRSWFAWVNTEFAKSIIDVAKRKPYLIFKTDKSITPESIAHGKSS